MLSTMFRRIALTGLLVTTFVGSGLLFGQATNAADAPNSVEISMKIEKSGANIGELNVSAPNSRNRRNRAFDWPFFSFKKGGR